MSNRLNRILSICFARDLTCCQCSEEFIIPENVAALFMDCPICKRCDDVLRLANHALYDPYRDRIFPGFTEEQAQQIMEVAEGRLTAWREANPSYFEHLHKTSPAYWAEKVFGIKPLSDEEREAELKRREEARKLGAVFNHNLRART